MMSFGKKQLVIASLVAALGAAVYLNWQFSGTVPVSTTGAEESSVKSLGQTTYVNTEISDAAKEDPASKTESSSLAVNAPAQQSGYFASEKQQRSQSNAEATAALTEIAEASSSSEKAKLEAVKAAKQLADVIKAQGDLEEQIKQKGFQDALVTLNNDTCTVTVYGGKLDDASAIAIKDLVNRQAGTDFDKITVSLTAEKE